ncbi:hypothetical protein PIB30_091766 [Stylosanthes scabra]|uniref:Uncharacterized protein n=1 Tax=Stylosanthes scabra TaxID=79078 RepID=A0ABU6YTY2_9FABA|nr:hypothetical protein [Stylosanthes scabra]
MPRRGLAFSKPPRSTQSQRLGVAKHPELKEIEKKKAWKARKEQNRAIGKKQSYSDQNRGLIPWRHYPGLGVAELVSYLSLIQHPTPRRDARRLGIDEAAMMRQIFSRKRFTTIRQVHRIK